MREFKLRFLSSLILAVAMLGALAAGGGCANPFQGTSTTPQAPVYVGSVVQLKVDDGKGVEANGDTSGQTEAKPQAAGPEVDAKVEVPHATGPGGVPVPLPTSPPK